MSVKANTVVSANLSAVRAVDFVTQFGKKLQFLQEVFPNLRFIEHKPGEQLYSRKAAVTLNTSTVDEGDEIPANAVTYTDVAVGTISWYKQSIRVTMEDIAKRGYDATVQAADNDMLFKVQNHVATNLVTFMQTGTLTSDYTTATFQEAVAEALGQVKNKWENLNLGYTEVIAFVNTLDLFRALGAANITTQTAFGLDYIKDYMGVSKLFFSSKIPQGKVIATVSENIIMDYIDAGNSEYAKAGINFATDGERNLVGVSIDPVMNRTASDLIMVTGTGLRAEYLDGIAVINITGVMPELSVVSAAGSSSGKTAITVSGYTLGTGDSYKYKVTDDEIVVRKGDSTASGWTNWNGSAEITAATGKHITIAVSNSNAVVAAGQTVVTAAT